MRMLTKMLRPAAAMLLFVLPIEAAAQWRCFEPSKPFCLGFGDPDDICRRSVEQYLEAERAFRQCVIDEGQTKVDQSRERSKKIVEQWNCYADGQKFCL